MRLLDDMAALLSELPGRRIALELLSEPPACLREATRWYELQADLVDRLVARGFPHWIVVTPACYSTLPEFLRFDPRPFLKAKTLFTFHFYEPYPFTQQGGSLNPPGMNRVGGLPFPFDEPRFGAAAGAVRKRILEDGRLTAEERHKMWRRLQEELELFGVQRVDEAWIDGRMAAAAAYLNALGVPANRVLMGEFGAVQARPGIRHGAEEVDRIRWLTGVRRAAERHGFAWAMWQLWGGYGLAERSDEPCIDADVLAALGLPPECAR
jgi:hypothetical protein